MMSFQCTGQRTAFEDDDREWPGALRARNEPAHDE